ncbi:Glyoxalase/bleomycin resistance protein/dioxygenase [Polychytrium aggregatum]|uniref:Glyoxalase/bleomycin resistance protein/dioxygenase n=1 Tax=Polychytrium aggregatum TaxID=110093 RepID=UPI0022FEDBA8|nr:Glyoxalase/bleomycin resistance protein/dioxygenase [Polychytrium aggregatum]KAI9202574.1 Glyoxalase/bleomycin resistance protein/dioxygenase [Polychytrium aggregatum]
MFRLARTPAALAPWARSFSVSSARLQQAPALTPFHHAFPVEDLEQARTFYKGVLGCPQGREQPGVWIDFDLFGHQIVAHQMPSKMIELKHRLKQEGYSNTNHVDGHQVPIPHFGVVLEWETFHKFVQKIRDAGIKFELEPYIRFEGLPGEQATMFFLDPSGNALEFKAFKDPSKLFAPQKPQ